MEDCWLLGLGLMGWMQVGMESNMSMFWMKMMQESSYKSQYETLGAGVASDHHLVPLHMTDFKLAVIVRHTNIEGVFSFGMLKDIYITTASVVII